MEEIKEVVIRFSSGREETLGTAEASLVLSDKRQEFLKGKKIVFERLDPLLRIYKYGEGVCFETSSGTKAFDTMEDLKADKYHDTLYQVYSKTKRP